MQGLGMDPVLKFLRQINGQIEIGQVSYTYGAHRFPQSASPGVLTVRHATEEKSIVQQIESRHGLSQSKSGIPTSNFHPNVCYANVRNDQICIYIATLVGLDPANLKWVTFCKAW